MKSFYLLTAFGPNRPGMVAQVTGVVFQSGGTIEDTSMTRLGGEFGMMLVVGLPNSAAGVRLLQALPKLQKKFKLNLNAKPIKSTLAHNRQPQATHMISIYGNDKPGIVYETAQILAKQRINITDLNTRVLPRSGKSFYVLLLEVQIPSKSIASAVRQKLERLGRSLQLDVTLQEFTPAEL